MQQQALNSLIARLKALEHTRTRMESLHADEKIVRRDVESVYEGLFLRAVTAFEAYLERLFHGVLAGQAKYAPTRVQTRITVRSPSAVREVILQGKKYAEWLPYSHTEERAEIYLRAGRPFSDLSAAEKETLNKIVLTRNAIAHASDHTRGKFKKDVLASHVLRPDERRPAGFLRSLARSGPAQTRYEIFVNELAALARKLA